MTHNHLVPGSSPGGTTLKTPLLEGFFCFLSPKQISRPTQSLHNNYLKNNTIFADTNNKKVKNEKQYNLYNDTMLFFFFCTKENKRKAIH